MNAFSVDSDILDSLVFLVSVPFVLLGSPSPAEHHACDDSWCKYYATFVDFKLSISCL
jgi:hypothetical protein